MDEIDYLHSTLSATQPLVVRIWECMSIDKILPGPLEATPAASWEIGHTVIGRAGPRTDLFTDPFKATRVDNAARLLFGIDEDFLLEAEVDVQFNATFDAGVLLLFQDDEHWAKLCYEFSPRREPTVVSVVTHGISDDCNSVVLPSTSTYLRIARRGEGFGFHYSTDGVLWHMVRAFRLAAGKPVRAGFMVQSPRGEGCQVEFRKIRLRRQTLGDMRSGE
jgi:regulation of enolase protein 1 (concanavalin A-like superfamily)